MQGRRRWRLLPGDAPRESALAAALGISPRLARLLVHRGQADAASATAYLGSRLSEHVRSPLLFRDMPRAAGRVVQALAAGERIGIYGDYDVDGVSGTAILLRFLRELGADPAVHIPNRIRDGYGLNEVGVRRLAEAGARVMITVDCGGVSHREIGLAKSLGLDTIVCDHHQVSGTPLPAYAVLNPIEPDSGFPFPGLCGAGVAFYLALGVRQQLRETRGAAVPDLRRYLDLVALGIVADIVPAVEENRVFLKYGLREISQGDRPGVAALKAVSGVGDATVGAVAFRLAPRLNAGGRLADAALSVELLTTDDQDRANELAARLEEENRARQAIERGILDEALAMVESGGGVVQRSSIVLGSAAWHPGVIGIVAARLVERYYRPTVLVALDAERGTGRGSARSIRGLNIYEAIRDCAGVLDGFGGHRMAAGLSIRNERLPELAEQFERAVAQRTGPDDFIPITDVDDEIRLSEVDESLMGELARLQPHGPSNAEPVFIVRGATLRSVRVVGESHLKVQLEQDGRSIRGIGFGMGDLPAREGMKVDCLFTPTINEWNGTRSVEVRLRDLRLVS